MTGDFCGVFACVGMGGTEHRHQHFVKIADVAMGLVCDRSLSKICERISNVCEPEILMIPIAPPGAVAKAQMVSLFIYILFSTFSMRVSMVFLYSVFISVV